MTESPEKNQLVEILPFLDDKEAKSAKEQRNKDFWEWRLDPFLSHDMLIARIERLRIDGQLGEF